MFEGAFVFLAQRTNQTVFYLMTIDLVEGVAMKIYDFKILLEPDDEAGGYVVTCPALPGCYTQGDTIDEAIENIKEAILLCLEDLQ